jgi:hypothetical protein
LRKISIRQGQRCDKRPPADYRDMLAGEFFDGL